MSKARILKLNRLEALAAANVIFPELMRADVDGWKDTVRRNREEGDDQNVLWDLTLEYMFLVNQLMAGVTRADIENGGLPEPDFSTEIEAALPSGRPAP